MNTDFDERVRELLSQAVRTLPHDENLATRIEQSTVRAPRTTLPESPARRWLMPLLTSAAIVAMVAGLVLYAVVTHPGRHAPPATPTPTTPTPTTTTVPSPTAAPSTSQPSTSIAPALPPGSPPPAGFVAQDIDFVDLNLGWALGNAPCASGLCAVVLRTLDGGAHWAALPAPKGVTPVNDQGNPGGGSCGNNGTVYGPCVAAIRFANARVGYLYSFGWIYLTTDGGLTWTGQQPGANSLVIAGGNVLRWTYVEQCSAGCPGRLYVAPTGSLHWREMRPGGSVSALYGSALTQAGGTAYFVATPSAGSATTLYRSTDGGITWVPRRTLDGLCPRMLGLTLTGAPDGTLVAFCRYGDGQSIGLPVQVSVDGGVTFTAHSALPQSGGPNTSMEVYAASSLDLVAEVYRPGYPVYRSGDSGSAWRRVTANTMPAESRSVIGSGEFVSVQTGFIMSGNGRGVLVTFDAGRTWQTRRFG